jgi:N-acetylneuraminic acid mutarotase
MATARWEHAAILLATGKVLVMGGDNPGQGGGPNTIGIQNAAELYDPPTDTWSSASGPLTIRWNATVTLLRDGRVLFAGGLTGDRGLLDAALNSGELYDPTSNTWMPVASMRQGRQLHTATRLKNGKVLLVGGTDSGQAVARAEVYDPSSNGVSSAGSTTPRYRHTATLLADGRVLITGGQNVPIDQAIHGPLPYQKATAPSLRSAEIYDPDRNTWSPAAPMSMARSEHAATALSDGRVVVVGGASGTDSSAEIYDPATNRWTSAHRLMLGRYPLTALTLLDGRVFVMGGPEENDKNTASVEVYDPRTDAWSPGGAATKGWSGFTATLLTNGKVLVAGGREPRGFSVVATCQLYTPG